MDWLYGRYWPAGQACGRDEDAGALCDRDVCRPHQCIQELPKRKIPGYWSAGILRKTQTLYGCSWWYAQAVGDSFAHAGEGWGGEDISVYPALYFKEWSLGEDMAVF